MDVSLATMVKGISLILDAPMTSFVLMSFWQEGSAGGINDRGGTQLATWNRMEGEKITSYG